MCICNERSRSRAHMHTHSLGLYVRKAKLQSSVRPGRLSAFVILCVSAIFFLFVSFDVAIVDAAQVKVLMSTSNNYSQMIDFACC